MRKKNLEITLVLISDNTFDVEVYEPESGEFTLIKCQDEEVKAQMDNPIVSEIYSWVSFMREEIQEGG